MRDDRLERTIGLGDDAVFVLEFEDGVEVGEDVGVVLEFWERVSTPPRKDTGTLLDTLTPEATWLDQAAQVWNLFIKARPTHDCTRV